MPQNIIIFIEPPDHKWSYPFKIANLYMNRFAIDEDAAFEIRDVIILPKRWIETAKPKLKKNKAGITTYSLRRNPADASTQTTILRNALRRTHNENISDEMLPIHMFYALQSIRWVAYRVYISKPIFKR